MAIYDLFIRRDKKQPDVFQYDDLPNAFRVQVVHILTKVIGDDDDLYAPEYWKNVAEVLAKELGLFYLGDDRRATAWIQCANFLLTSSTDEALSLIEISFRHAPNHQRNPHTSCPQLAVDGIDELNARFKMHGIGYEFVNDRIVRIDSQYLHSESIKPALVLLKSRKFKGAESEFMQAHEHFRKGKYEDTLTWALKAFESVMKTICDARKISYAPQKDTAKDLIEKMFSNKVIPAYLQSEFTGLRSILESGSPTLRNKAGGHGRGAKPRNIPESFAAYALHMAASNIVFLVECHKPTQT